MSDNKIIFRVDDYERLRSHVSIDDWIGFEERNIKSQRDVLAWFVVDENGEYVDYDIALKMIGKLPLSQLGELVNDFAEALADAASPLKNGSA